MSLWTKLGIIGGGIWLLYFIAFKLEPTTRIIMAGVVIAGMVYLSTRKKKK